MRRKLLNDAQETWLCNNYRDMGNEELAQELTRMVLDENQREYEQCKRLLEDVWSFREKSKLVMRMRTLKSFKAVSVAFVKRRAKELGCRGKSARFLSRSNSAKANKAYWERLMASAELVTSPYQWFSTFKLDEQRIALLENDKRYGNMRNSICNWNREHGEAKGIILVPQWNKEILAVKVVAKSLYK